MQKRVISQLLPARSFAWVLDMKHLLENARKFVADGLRPGVEVSEGSRGVDLSVTTPGAVIEPAEAPRLFDRYFRGTAARGATRGTGIGLSNTRARLHELYGPQSALELANYPAGGTLVSLLIPLRRAQPEVDDFNYVPRVRLPVLMLNGRHDNTFPLETAVKPMYELLGSPADRKRLVVAEGVHYVPRNVLIGETLNWFDRHLGRTK